MEKLRRVYNGNNGRHLNINFFWFPGQLFYLKFIKTNFLGSLIKFQSEYFLANFIDYYFFS